MSARRPQVATLGRLVACVAIAMAACTPPQPHPWQHTNDDTPIAMALDD